MGYDTLCTVVTVLQVYLPSASENCSIRSAIDGVLLACNCGVLEVDNAV